MNRKQQPLYLQIYEKLRKDIITEHYPYHTKLPSKRGLAEELGVSTVTVEHAYALLCDEGYAEARQRSGYLVIFRKTDGFAAAATATPLSTHSHGAHLRPTFPLSVLRKTMRKVLSDNDLLSERSPNSGCTELREAIRHYLARNRGIEAETEQIVIGAGSEYLYRLIVELLGTRRTYAIETPSYKKIGQVYAAARVPCEELPLTKHGIESGALAASKATVLHTTPYRSYPSGVTATASKRHEYVRWSANGDRFIIEDDFESEFSVSAKPTETLFALSPYDNVIYLNTFSNSISPSLRVGYMVLPKQLTEAFHQRLGFYSCTVPTFMQLVLAELLRSGDFERHINRVRRHKRQEQQK